MSCIVPGCQFTKNSNEKISMHLFPEPQREPQRHLSWVKMINCERIFKFDPYVVFKRFRVCRNHFSSDCFNGQCKKLLPSAVPSLYLNTTNPDRLKTKYQIYEQKVINLLKNNSVNIEVDALKLINIDDSQTETHLIKIPENELKLSYDEKLWNSASGGNEENDNEEFVLMEVVNDNQENQSFTIVLPQQDIIPNSPPKVLNYQKPVAVKTPISNQMVLKKSSLKQKSTIQPLNKPKLKYLQANFAKCPKNLIVQNICTKTNPFEVLPNTFCESDFNHKIDLKINYNEDEKEFWCHAAFKLIRLPFMKNNNLEDFEFSQSYFYFWDMFERSYFFLNNIVETQEQSIENIKFFLDNPLNKDTGNWTMFANIINKHGLIPKQFFSQNFNSQSKSKLNEILRSKLLEFAKVLRDLHAMKRSVSEIQLKIDEQMCEIYNIIAVLFGCPQTEKFTWKFIDKNGKTCNVGPITSLEFYELYVKPYFNVDDKITLISDSRSTLEFGKSYGVSYLGNVVGGQQVTFNNQPFDTLVELISKSIVDGEAVLTSCNISGLNDFQLQNLSYLCDVKIKSNLEKSERIAYGDFNQKQSMIISAIETDRSGNLVKIKLENFTKDETKLYAIPKKNLTEIISDIVIDKKYLTNEIINVDEHIILDQFDALSTLTM
ncbi:hypothetical protein PVAND_012552 [Polypedilum vanderplanki]|uniref:THAP-type domain-containing protein n=1 Tax=Polypedilum vanderplanki TaxID=319348 RepID=A0A9J6CMR9_POLVA|nr:hypothetical protein PVAND_012552 [Polypedilum vanderplanki]